MYYSGQEIIEIAVRIEENGYAFYTAAAEAIKTDNDIKRLLLDLAERHIFGKAGAGNELAKTVRTPKEALEIALKFENDSVAFYTELEKRTESDAKKLIYQIIEEEKEHAEDIKKFM
ncbi:MAG: hypothetical protein ISS17_04205 [Bacteroidales bacterium]|nr:hypothetical protein [Bacteroidales bacterium]